MEYEEEKNNDTQNLKIKNSDKNLIQPTIVKLKSQPHGYLKVLEVNSDKTEYLLETEVINQKGKKQIAQQWYSKDCLEIIK